jgi:hypothetical protein
VDVTAVTDTSDEAWHFAPEGTTMVQDDRNPLEVLRFELQFLEAGGYGRSPRDPHRSPLVFEDSLSCINLGCKTVREPCCNCLLMMFVPPASCLEATPCRHIPLNEAGETIDSFYRHHTQLELEGALEVWLRANIKRLEEGTARPTAG